MLRLLAQEDRHGAIRGLCDIGRASHRAWVAALFAPWLNPLPTEGARERLDALVVATDVYVWKLIRVDLERPAAALRTLMRGMIHAALNPPTPQQEMQP